MSGGPTEGPNYCDCSCELCQTIMEHCPACDIACDAPIAEPLIEETP